MRTPVLLESWWKRTVFGEVAEYSLTGTLTSPKLIAPDQIARAIYIFVYPMPRAGQSAERVLAARGGCVRRRLPGETGACGCPRFPRPRARWGHGRESA